MPRIKAIFFDMDGVLIDAKEWHYEALNRALAFFGQEIPRTAHLDTFDGLPTRQKLLLLSSSRNLPRGLHPFLSELKQRYTLELAYANCKPVFQHQFALSKLRMDGYVLAVCSNSVRTSVQMMLERAELLPYLSFTLSSDDVSAAKPSPEIYLKAMERTGVRANECLILEDNPHGIEAARASGGHTLVIGRPEEVSYDSIRREIARIELGAQIGWSH